MKGDTLDEAQLMPFSLGNRLEDQAPVDLALPGGLHGPGVALAQMGQELHFYPLTSSLPVWYTAYCQTPW